MRFDFGGSLIQYVNLVLMHLDIPKISEPSPSCPAMYGGQFPSLGLLEYFFKGADSKKGGYSYLTFHRGGGGIQIINGISHW